MIHKEWAFRSDAERCAAENKEELAKLEGRYVFVERGQEPWAVVAANKDKTVIRRLMPTAGQLHFKIEWNGAHLTADELALVCDNGNLCFGYSRGGEYINVFTD